MDQPTTSLSNEFYTNPSWLILINNISSYLLDHGLPLALLLGGEEAVGPAVAVAA